MAKFWQNAALYDFSQAGEQYFLDLGGNIKKGPTSKSSSCYCGPAFQKFEKKLEKDKQVLDLKPQWLFVHVLHVVHLQELLKHIDNSHSKLDNKISHLERKTRDQLFNLNQTMKESFASERFDSLSYIVKSEFNKIFEFYDTNVMFVPAGLSAWTEWTAEP